MRIKLDENLPAVLVDVLAEFGHDAETSPSEGLTGKKDAEVWEAAVSPAV
jgi:predicted nuclease of predicted toxin-antitoxin system